MELVMNRLSSFDRFLHHYLI